MIGGGCGSPCPSDQPGFLIFLINNVTAAIPGSDKYYVPYDNATAQAKASTPYMIAALNSYVAACPTTPVVFIGYSLGGIISKFVICSRHLSDLDMSCSRHPRSHEHLVRRRRSLFDCQCSHSNRLWRRNVHGESHVESRYMHTKCGMSCPDSDDSSRVLLQNVSSY